MDLEGETAKRIDSINGSDTTAAVATKVSRIGIGGNRSENMKATAAAQDWLVIRRRQQRDNRDCGRNGGGENLVCIGGNVKTARRQQKQQ